ncbi:MAG: hypothetical protein IV086_07870 [Hyphomonadaceae bacterium]|nr:hypothetical protein [Hyphomonadaceae bacterium]
MTIRRRGMHGRAAALEMRNAALFEAGWRAALATASAVGAIALAAQWPALRAYPGSGPDLSPEAASHAPLSLLPLSTGTTLPLDGDEVAAADTRVARPAPLVSARALAVPPASAPGIEPAPMAQVAVAPNQESDPSPSDAIVQLRAPMGPPDVSRVPLTLNLSSPRGDGRRERAAGASHLAGFVALRAPASQNALRSRAEAWVPDWRAPAGRDLALFVAADDEALSWSFSDSSPNQGRLAYQSDRVEVGQMSAGVSLAVRDMQLALAYVSREEPSQLGYTAREDYAGMVWTFKR